MIQQLRSVVALCLVGAALVSCAGTPAPVAPVPSSTIAAAPTAVLITPSPATITFASGSRIGGVDVAGLTTDAARTKVDQALEPLRQPLLVSVGTQQFTLSNGDLSVKLALDGMLAQAEQAARGGTTPNVALSLTYDTATVRDRLSAAATHLGTPGTVRLITATDTISRSFVSSGGASIDIDQSLAQVDTALHTLGGPRTVEIPLSYTPVRASQGDLKNAIEELASEWDGVAGIYLYDMASGETITVNPNTVFSGASVLKVPIMLQVHLKLPVLDDKEQVWLREMILDSNNLSANALLAHSAGGISTEDALEGVRQMTATMQQLGLKHTYQNLPYESGDYLIKVRKLPIPKGPAKEGTAPYTEADPYVRTTPAEIGSLFVMLTECAQGKGRLLKEFGTALTETRCGEMLKLLRSNHDTTRMVAGLPAGTKVAHKSGWVEDMQADVGLVESPGGNYVLAVYLYQQQRNSYLSDNEATPWLAAFSRLVYSGYNPGQE